MKKKIAISLLVVSVALFFGCSEKAVEVDASKNTKLGGTGSGMGGTDGTLGRMGVSGGVSGSDNFVDFDSKSSLIKDAESKLQSIYFDFDRFNIRSDMVPILQSNANILLNPKLQGVTIKLEGNCDEFGTDEYNYALGLKRAKSVKDELILKGIPESSITLVSFGESKPACLEKTKECYAKNRRVDTKILP